jgi:hypothetical protein
MTGLVGATLAAVAAERAAAWVTVATRVLVGATLAAVAAELPPPG